MTAALVACAIALLALVTSHRPDAALAAVNCPSEGAVSETGGGHTVTFNYEFGAPQTVQIPAGVDEVTVDVEGGNGGEGGGPGGGVQASFPVAPGECLQAWVGGYGAHQGGLGWAHGGKGGENLTRSESDGGGGGGASAVGILEETGAVLEAVAGGGGGGGGDGADDAFGGGGGAGGLPALAGSAAPSNPDSGGCGGCRGDDHDGAHGDEAGDLTSGGAGGGGGAGDSGGGGGKGGTSELETGGSTGGGGGGGGKSYVGVDPQEPQRFRFFTSTRACPDSAAAPATCNGVVRISWALPKQVAPVSGSGQHAATGAAFAQPLRAKVTDTTGAAVAGVAVNFAVPQRGASGSFPSGADSAVATTDANGIATSPTLAANAVAGPWTVEATIAESPVPARFALTNDAQATTTTVTSTLDPSQPGEKVSFRAQVIGAVGGLAPSGEVQFRLDGKPLGTPQPLNREAVALSPTATPALGNHEVEAVYRGSPAMLGSAGKAVQRVVRGVTATEVSSSTNPSAAGEAVTFTAHVNPAVESTVSPPTGTVQFAVDGTPLGAPVAVDGSGDAVSPGTAGLAIGARTVTAAYSGDADWEASNGKATQMVGPDATATVLATSDNPAFYGDPLTLTATVRAGAGTTPPDGVVTFRVDGHRVCDATLAAEAPPTVESEAVCAVDEPLAPGPHELEASYGGSADFGASAGTAIEQIAASRTATEVEVVPAPVAFGAPASLRATVDAVAPGDGAPAGSVRFLVDGEDVSGAIPLGADGTAEAGPIASLAAGGHAVEALYEGGTDYTASRGAAPFRIDRAATGVALSSSANPSLPDEALGFAAKVAATAPSQATPTGTVQFVVDGEDAGEPVPLADAFAASPTVPPPALGTHEVLAYFSGDESFAPSAARLDQRVEAPAPPAAGPGHAADAGPLPQPAPPAPHLELVGGRLAVASDGTVPVTLRCVSPTGVRCADRLTLRAGRSQVLGKGRATLAAGHKGSFALRLSSLGRKAASSAPRTLASLDLGPAGGTRRVVLLTEPAEPVSFDRGVIAVGADRLAEVRVFCHADPGETCRAQVLVAWAGRQIATAPVRLGGRRHATVHLRLPASLPIPVTVRAKALSTVPVGPAATRSAALRLIPADPAEARDREAPAAEATEGSQDAQAR